MKRNLLKMIRPVVALRLLCAWLMLMSSGPVWSSTVDEEQLTVSGTVKDESGEALPGATIVEKSTMNGTVTDLDGRFKLSVEEDAILIVSFVGYETMEIDVSGRSVIEITLRPDFESLDEVVVVGYGTQKKETLTGSVSSVQGEEFVKSPQPNLSGAFAGRVPGVIALNRSGEPGEDNTTLRIRGISTPGNNDPLVVIDGVANRLGGLNRLDPNDIASISVLKDASAAIYGSQAANGVILVTTKRGEQGKPTFSFSHNQGFVQPTVLPEMADAPTYARIINEINYYRNPDGGMNQIYSEEEIGLFQNGSDPNNYPNSDWVSATIRDWSSQDQQSLSVSGGGEQVSYFASLGRINQESIYENGITKYQQYSLRTNLDMQVNDQLNIGVDITARQENRLYPTRGAGDIFRAIYRTYPTIPITYSNGLPSAGVEDAQNPLVMVTDAPGTDRHPATVLNTMLKFDYTLPFLEEVSIKGFYAHDRSFRSRKLFATPYTVYRINNSTDPVSYDRVVGGPGSRTPELTQRQQNQMLQTFNLSVNFEKDLGKSYIKGFVAYEQQEDNWNEFQAFRAGFLSDQIPELSQGGSEPTQSTNSGYSTRFTRRNYFGRFAYDYDQKYLLEVQARYDGSSIFKEGNQYGFFPSVSAGWRISEESWFSVGAINNLKLRGSYGLLGNDRVDAFQYLNSYNLRQMDYVSSNLQPLPIFTIHQLANPEITWETAKKLDVGLELTLFENIKLELDYFNERREDLLTARQGSLPQVTGIVNERGVASMIPQENIGEVENKGFEAILNFQENFGEVQFFASANATYSQNRVVFLDDAAGIPDYQLRKGKVLGSYLVYDAIGIFKNAEDLDNNVTLPGQQLGDLIYRDVDGDGEITELDRVRLDKSNVPQLVYGASFGAGFKGFDLSVLLQGQAKVVQHVMPESGEVGNFFSTWADNRWSPTNPGGTYPRVDVRTSSSINGGLFYNDFWLQNTAFLRIKNVELGYTLPEGLLEKIGLQSARVYMSGFNLATFTAATDIDPEGDSGNGQFYPQQKIVNLGVNIKF
ncbi:SusC/RagA family TonB-linked outer membrane protein [Marinoscillum furvescens]|uniref:TonB-linked SusC/RagA family outer membrane protein n=1 Tax=Marinoscillum furvescens DSM 4134 TaxID=1122208 RepID=A0A3D9L2X9_MARFU|nr:TonB-dependent receptor [Marinoscillum furvescens]RED97011.1 TonB-linked SusC/RagA family outer membrane protein [Marinoscillum furvescens DSM 4134]